KKVDLFAPLGDNEINLLAERSSIFRYTRGEPIVRQGDTGDSLYIVRNGSVEVTVSTGKTEPVPVATMGPGGFFGEMSLLTGEPRSATVSALEETQVVVVRKEGLKIVLDSNPSLVEPLTAMLDKRREELETTKQKAASGKKHVEVKTGHTQKEDLLARVRAFFKL
ncbi:MAG TPA: cyclic nucleotide-binding domain-containing protein, partial [Candidatus Sabulitectum sp.]|nr:cyclic nucleotide-binding domain-containing protein [Candidatus Sabulitectum sp.]